MDSYTDEYYTTESAFVSPYGTWKRRMFSAKRDFPKPFDDVTMLQNISATAFGARQLPKRRKVAVVRDFPIGMSDNCKEDVGPVASEEGFTNSRTDIDELIKSRKRMIDLPYEGARVVSDDLVTESSGSSINREMPSSDYKDTDLDPLIKTRKRKFELPYEGARVVSDDDLVSESSGSSINKKILSSDYYEDTDIERVIKTRKGTIDSPYEVSDDLDSVSDEDSDYKEDEKLGSYTELKIHGASVKDIRLIQSQGQIQIQLSIDNLQHYSISIKPSGKESRTVKRMTTNHTDTRKRKVSVDRCFPPGCGPDAECEDI